MYIHTTYIYTYIKHIMHTLYKEWSKLLAMWKDIIYNIFFRSSGSDSLVNISCPLSFLLILSYQIISNHLSLILRVQFDKLYLSKAKWKKIKLLNKYFIYIRYFVSFFIENAVNFKQYKIHVRYVLPEFF